MKELVNNDLVQRSWLKAFQGIQPVEPGYLVMTIVAP
jgi:hypothetical protein